MNITLFHDEPNGPSFTALAALEETGIEADRVHINLTGLGRHEREWSAQLEVAMSIEGEGPVLFVDGEAMTDSVFIACFLDEIGPSTRLRPTEPYARWEVMTWCRQIIERLAPAAALLGCQAYGSALVAAVSDEDYAARSANIVSEDLRQRWDICRKGRFDAAQIADSIVKVGQAVANCEARLHQRDWLFGEFSIADMETYAWLAGMADILPDAFSQAPMTQAWLAQVRSRPAIVRSLQAATVAAPERYWAPGPEINRWG